MGKSFLSLSVLILIIGQALAANRTVVPTTSLAAETGNNTSGASTFTTQSNGNIGATNISKVSARTLLYPGSTVPIFAHWVPWFGGPDHMQVGYNSNDPAQVQRQVADMRSRGLNGTIINWYGTESKFTNYNAATLLMMQEAERQNGQFTFSIMEDVGALKTCANTLGCDVTGKLISDLNYIITNMAGSPAYFRMDGRPVISFFGTEAYSIDWSRVTLQVAGNPMFIQRNPGGFTYAQSTGGFQWVAPETVSATDPMALNYVDYFYSTSLNYLSTEKVFGSGYMGFNDTLALWGSARIIDRQCGQTWIKSLAESGKYYSSAKQMHAMQLVTWNDYEEGTELETGIDNCVNVTAAMSGDTLTWNITGNENTIDHYTAFISSDGQNLMPLADMPVGTRSLDIFQFGFASGNYTLYVKAIGKPMMTNKMSSPASYQVAAPLIATPGSTSLSPAFDIDFGASGLSFAKNQGYVITPGVSDPKNYSVMVKFTIDTNAGWVKLLDFHQGASDQGLYSYNGYLWFYGFGNNLSTLAIPAGQQVTLIQTRGSDNQVRIYVNGQLLVSFADGVAGNPLSGALNILKDDLVTAGREASSGILFKVQTYNGVLSQTDISTLSGASTTTTPIPPAVNNLDFGAGGFTFAKNQGYVITPGVSDPSNYSVMVKFSMDTNAGWAKLLDFHQGATDQGLYSYNGYLWFYGFGNNLSTLAIPAGQQVTLIQTRGSDNQVRLYLNGQLLVTFADSGNTLSVPLNILKDDLVTAGREASSGILYKIQTYNGVLSQPDIATLSQ